MTRRIPFRFHLGTGHANCVSCAIDRFICPGRVAIEQGVQALASGGRKGLLSMVYWRRNRRGECHCMSLEKFELTDDGASQLHMEHEPFDVFLRPGVIGGSQLW